MDLVDPYGWHKIDKSEIATIREKLSHFESMTWSEILVTAKKRNHTVQVSSLCSAAQKRLREAHCNDVDELVSLHLSGRERIWGILREGVLTVLWWDPNHEVCPSMLKHT
jgi:hypothetical protein